jgi:hypothetical protein
MALATKDNRGGLEKDLANLWSGEKIAKKEMRRS